MARRYDTNDATDRATGLREAASAIRRGELVVLPTDTVYGIGADACSKGVQARWMTATEAASRLEDLQARLQSVAARLMSLPPVESTRI